METLDKLIVEEITCRSKSSIWMKPPYSGNGCLIGLSSIRRPSQCQVSRFVSVYSMMFAQWQNCLTTHFSERIPAVKWRMTVYFLNDSAHVNIAKESVIQIMLQFTRKIIIRHSHDGHGFARGMEFCNIIHARYWKMTPTGQECVCLWIFQDELLCNHMTASFSLSGQHSTHSPYTVSLTHILNSFQRFLHILKTFNNA